MKKVYEVIAQFLKSKEVIRVFGLCGGHIQPLWDEMARLGLKIVGMCGTSKPRFIWHRPRRN